MNSMLENQTQKEINLEQKDFLYLMAREKGKVGKKY